MSIHKSSLSSSSISPSIPSYDSISLENHPTYGKELCLLCLDGGGVRGLSTLLILKRLMESINPSNPPKPCDYFDMIGGTSTGGLIALMLGRLAMPVDEAIAAYIVLTPKIFTKVHHRVTLRGEIQGRFDHTAIEDGVRQLVDDKGFKPDDLLKNSSDSGCKTFVCATSKHASETVILSSYLSKRRGSDLLNTTKIWEAARATAAASSFFDPITIGGLDLIDGATPANNPVNEMWTEAFDIFKEGDDWRLEDNIHCLVSIGTGIPAIKPFGDDPLKLGKALLAIATDTEKRAEDFHRHHSHMAQSHRYFRFNVLRGLEAVGLEEASKRHQIIACTEKYLQSESIYRSIEACTRKLIERENLQPLIEAAQEKAREATNQFQSLRKLEAVQEALKPSSDSLAWFTNTTKYRRWLKREEEAEYIWYPISDDSASLGHKDIAAAISHHILEDCNTKDGPTSHILYVGNPTTHPGSVTAAARSFHLATTFVSLVSQVLVAYDDIRRTILSFPRPSRNLLKNLFTPGSDISDEEMADLLLACLHEMANLDGVGDQRPREVIIVIEHSQKKIGEPACKLAFKVARLSGNARLLVSSHSSEVGRLASWEGLRIDESTECTECLESLRFEAMFDRRDQITRAETGTNEWIWSCAPYVEWATETSGILWIQGKPGSGKSVLAKSILERLGSMSDSQPLLVANWFYHERGGKIATSHTSMLRAILYQILKQNRTVFRYYWDDYRTEDWLGSLPRVFSRLAEAGPDISPIMCLVDAMDESRDESIGTRNDSHNSQTCLEDILALFLDVTHLPASRIKFLVLSRPNLHVERSFRHYHMVVLEKANTKDIEMIVDSGLRALRKAMTSFDSSDEGDEHPESTRGKRHQPQLHIDSRSSRNAALSARKSRSKRMFKLSRDSEDKELSAIRDYILEHARGVILWVALIINDLLRHVEKGMFTFTELKRLLHELPLEIHGMYRRILSGLQRSNSEIDQIKARRILLWVIGASETKLLELQELLDALAITWDLETALRSPEDPVTSNRPQIRSWTHFRRSIHELCGPFIEVIRPTTSTSDELFDDIDVEPTFLVQLLHQTAKDFLGSDDAQNFQVVASEAKIQVTEDKITYLKAVVPQVRTSYVPKMKGSEMELIMNVEELAYYFEKKTLLKYAIETLPLHVCRSHIHEFEHATIDANTPSLWALFAKNQYPDIDIIQSAENNIVGCYFSFAIKFGLVTAVKNTIALTSATSWWWGNYKHLVENTALLAAVDYGLPHEVKYLLHTHPSGTPFLQMNAALLDRAVDSGGIHGSVARLISLKGKGSPIDLNSGTYYVAERKVSPESLPQVDEEPKDLSSLIGADIEEVKEAIRAVMFL